MQLLLFQLVLANVLQILLYVVLQVFQVLREAKGLRLGRMESGAGRTSGTEVTRWTAAFQRSCRDSLTLCLVGTGLTRGQSWEVERRGAESVITR